jgi:hypothetical protein
VILLAEVFGELVERIHIRIDLPSDRLLHLSEFGSNIHCAQAAEKHYIDVATGYLFSASHRSVDKGKIESLRTSNFFPQPGNDTARLLDQSAQLGENWGILIGLDICSTTVNPLFKDAHVDKRVNLSLQGGGASAERRRELAEIPGFVRPQKESR